MLEHVGRKRTDISSMLDEKGQTYSVCWTKKDKYFLYWTKDMTDIGRAGQK